MATVVKTRTVGWTDDPIGLIFLLTKQAVYEPSPESEELGAFIFDDKVPEVLSESEQTGEAVPVRFEGQKGALLVEVLSIGPA